MFYTTSSLRMNAKKASLLLANKIAKQCKSFAETEFIKDCMADAVIFMFPEVVKYGSNFTVTKN